MLPWSDLVGLPSAYRHLNSGSTWKMSPITLEPSCRYALQGNLDEDWKSGPHRPTVKGTGSCICYLISNIRRHTEWIPNEHIQWQMTRQSANGGGIFSGTESSQNTNPAAQHLGCVTATDKRRKNPTIFVHLGKSSTFGRFFPIQLSPFLFPLLSSLILKSKPVLQIWQPSKPTRHVFAFRGEDGRNPRTPG